jgi:hypothetical protein
MMKASAVKIESVGGHWNVPPDGGFLFDYVEDNMTPEHKKRLDEGFA